MLLWALCLTTNAQNFRNLTADEVRIDEALPVVSQEFDIDDVNGKYSVSLDYPEYIDMTSTDILRLKKLTKEIMPETPHIDINVGTERKKATLTASFVPIVFKEGRWRKIVSFRLTLHKTATAKAKTLKAENDGERYAEQSVLSQGNWAKIRVKSSGIHELTAEVVRKAGFSDLSRIKVYGYGGALQPEVLNADYLKATDDLKEVPMCNADGHMLFYAQGTVSWDSGTRIRNPYSDYAYYFITEGDETTQTLSREDFTATFFPTADFPSSLYEVDDFAWYHGGRNLFDATTFGNGTTKSYSLPMTTATTGKGKLTVAVSADKALTASVTINGKELGSIPVSNGTDYDHAKTATRTFTIDNIGNENNVTIRQSGEGNLHLDYIALTSDDSPTVPELTGSAFPKAEYDSRIATQNLHADKALDMIIVIPQSRKWEGEAERLKQLHESMDGLRTKIVAEDELWNEFSSGTPDATALRRYMKMLYDRAETEADMPRYLLLFGDGAWDNRMLSSEWRGEDRRDFLLCFESENSTSAVESFVTDEFYTMLDDGEQLSTGTQYTGKPDVAVGRLTARNETQAKTLVDKIVSYATGGETGTWRNTLVFMGDDGNSNTHMQDADKAAETVRALMPQMDIKKVMWDAYKMEKSSTGNAYPEVTKLLQQQMQSGALMMNYSGHGRADCLSHEYVLKLGDFNSIKTKRLPMWITASCDIMPFDGQEENIGETAMHYADGGAIAFLGTTRTVYADRNSFLNRATLKHLFTRQADGTTPTIGEAVRRAKVELSSTYTAEAGGSLQDLTVNKLQYVLLGDPALRLLIPNMKAEIDSINGIKVDGESVIRLKAGEKVMVAGHTDGDFNGKLTATVKGAEETITCRLNNTTSEGADWTFKYIDRTSTFFRGSDSIRSGRFNFEFVVPKDIVYSDNQGQILIYAADAEGRQANGSFEGIAFNGTALSDGDKVGPSIYCYLNSSSFTNGDVVNASPYFMAEIIDESGINSTGAGIGHDLQLTIDGDMNRTYTLNDYFNFDFGSYQSGTVGFQIPALDEGSHTLTFRAWDIYNNSSTSTLDFIVGNSAPKLFEVESTANPASTTTSFRIIHDRIGSAMDITIDIYDMAGRKLWSKHQQETPSSSTIMVDWDLTTTGGSRIGTGVYLYRVKMATSEGEFSSRTKKLVILSNK